MSKPRVLILRTAGTNCDVETGFAFEQAGATTDFVHINEFTAHRKELNDYHILALSGGFTYGDDIASGKILANELTYKLEDSLQRFVADGKLIIGICNGFQILVKAGLLPNLSGDFRSIEATLTLNDSNKFEDRWIHLKSLPSKCIWTTGIKEIIHLPVAHGEGKFIPKNTKVLKTLKKDGMIALEYADQNGNRCGYPQNPNGSVENIAGICDVTGRIFGLMPHPERHISLYQSPYWTRSKNRDSGREEGDGFRIFLNGVKYIKKHL